MYKYLLRAVEISRWELDLGHSLQPLGYPLWIAFWRGVAGGGWWLLKASRVALVVGGV